MSWLNTIDTLFTFLFLGSKGKPKIELNWELSDSIEGCPFDKKISEAAYAAKVKYEIQIRKGFGLGFISSFIPGTASFRARMAYLRQVLACDKNSLAQMKDNNGQITLVNRFELALLISPLYFFKKFFTAWICVLSPVKFNLLNDLELMDMPALREEGYAFLPSDASSKIDSQFLRGLFYLLYYCTNPVSFVSLALILVHDFVNHSISSLSSEGTWLSVILKSISAGVFIPLRLAIATLAAAIASCWEVVGFLTLEPAKFISASFKQTLLHWNEDWNPEIIASDKFMLQCIKIIRKVYKALEEEKQAIKYVGPGANSPVDELVQQSYSQICTGMKNPKNHDRRYLTLSKDKVYQLQPLEENTPVILATTSNKLAEFEFYKKIIEKNKEAFRLLYFCPAKKGILANQTLNNGQSELLATIREEFSLLAGQDKIKLARSI